MNAKHWSAFALLFAFACSSSGDGAQVSLLVAGESVACTQHIETGEPVDGTRGCQTVFSECSDEHEYSFTCVSTVGSGRSACECFVDTANQGSYIDLSGECPVDSTTVAEACGWR